jgi:hypothetical protein
MKTEQIIEGIRELLGKHQGDERELMEALDAEAEGWRMRLAELEADEA